MKYKFNSDLRILVNKNEIIFLKGVFQYSYSEIDSRSLNFNKFKNVISKIESNYDFKKNEYDEYLKELIKLGYIIETEEFDNDIYIISSQNTFEYLKEKLIFKFKFIDLYNFNENNFGNKKVNYIVVSDSDSVHCLENLNELLVNKKIKSTWFVLDSDLFYCFISDHENGCYRCLVERLLSKMGEIEINKFNSLSNRFLINKKNISENINFLVCYLEYFLKNKFKNINLLNRKIFSLFIPTLEQNVSSFLKMPTCNCCGRLNNGFVSKSFNNIDNLVDELFMKESYEK